MNRRFTIALLVVAVVALAVVGVLAARSGPTTSSTAGGTTTTVEAGSGSTPPTSAAGAPGEPAASGPDPTPPVTEGGAAPATTSEPTVETVPVATAAPLLGDGPEGPFETYPIPPAENCVVIDGDTITIVFTGTSTTPRCVDARPDQLVVIDNQSGQDITAVVDITMESINAGERSQLGQVADIIDSESGVAGTRYFWFSGFPDLSGVLRVQ